MPQPRSDALAALGRALRAVRQEMGLSQEKLAEASGLHRNMVGAVERGEISPTYTTVVTLAEAVGMKASELVALAEADPAPKR